jgi:hypothetical protein
VNAISLALAFLLSGPYQHEQHQHEPPHATAPDLPRLGRSQEAPEAPLIDLAELERIALENNPTLAQAQAEIRTGEARRAQSGF